MTFSDAIKTGINIVNKNWMLVFINVVSMIVTLIGFAIIIIVPLVILFIIIGADSISSIKDINPEALFSAKYLWLALFFAAFALVYTIFVTVAMLFIYGASSGVLAKTLSDENYIFSFSFFMSEGKRLFMPMLSYTSLVGLAAIAILVVAAVVLFIFYNVLPSESAGFAVTFLKYLFFLLVLAAAFFVFNAVIALTFYGSAAIAVGNLKTFEVFKDCIRVMMKNPSTFWFYLVLLFLLVFAKIILLIITLLMSAIPLIGIVFGFTLNITMPVVVIYLTYIFMASLFTYYFGLTQIKSDTLSQEIIIEQ
ncbi:hypothetical protein [Candidatus Magnetomonas plexicatena]|uniref:hypothetical protein n=1 Tax=Candidatus Magnetomonas plexicatena TaxID=2552947 RepID=UPI001C7945B1|nr:hypothetical protein E2O03_002900 [Nitrospirales bacterium LBB_01]